MNAGQQPLLVQFGVWRYVQEGGARISRFLPQGTPRIMYCYPSTPLEAVVPQISSFLTAEYRMNIAVFQKRIERVMRLVMAGMMRAQTARRAENAPSAKRVKVEGVEVKRESEEEESVKEEDMKEESVKEEDTEEEEVKSEEMEEEDTEEEVTVKEEDTDSTEESTKEVTVKEDAKNTPHTFDEAINAILNERDWRKPNGTR